MILYVLWYFYVICTANREDLLCKGLMPACLWVIEWKRFCLSVCVHEFVCVDSFTLSYHIWESVCHWLPNTQIATPFRARHYIHTHTHHTYIHTYTHNTTSLLNTCPPNTQPNQTISFVSMEVSISKYVTKKVWPRLTDWILTLKKNIITIESFTYINNAFENPAQLTECCWLILMYFFGEYIHLVCCIGGWLILLFCQRLRARVLKESTASKPHIVIRLLTHHHFDEFFIVYLPIAINIGFSDHFIDFLVGEFLA